MLAVRILPIGLACVALTLSACTGEDVTPIGEGPLTTTVQETPHLLEPTDEMRSLARQQCLDDPDLVQGEIRVVDPDNPDQVLASVVVDCASVE